MNQFLGMTSEWLADVFLSEYTYAINPESMKSYSVDDDELYATLNRDGQSHLDVVSDSLSGGEDKNEEKDEDKNLTATQKVEGWPDELEENDQKQHGDSKPSDKWTELSATSKQAIKPFNPRRRVGRPHKDGAADKEKQSRKRKEYNKGSKLRNAAREDDVVTVEEFLKARQAPLMELSSFVNTFEVRHVQLKSKRLRVEKVIFESAVIPYMLHETIVKEALAMIDRTWDFLQRQLMAMQYVGSMVKTCREGMDSYSWLMSEGDETFEKEGAESIAERILNSWPNKRLQGIGEGFHLEWSHLYCARDKCWYNDNVISAFTKTLTDKYSNNTTIVLPALKTPSTDKGSRVLPMMLSLLAVLRKILCSCQ
ncbi:hypothetical protein GQ600_9553 [Phytophthora cactorum]|nr:hypothetical protein GQ600_9553 [Phytophthora cactorum]